MKTKIKVEKEVTITHVEITVPVRYEEQDIPNDFPFRSGDVWKATINIDTGQIEGWPKGRKGHMEMKVCDCGTYRLLSFYGDYLKEEASSLVNAYVPHGVVPGSCGDYIFLNIDYDGIITNWPKHPDVSAFFEGD